MFLQNKSKPDKKLNPEFYFKAARCITKTIYIVIAIIIFITGIALTGVYYEYW